MGASYFVRTVGEGVTAAMVVGGISPENMGNLFSRGGTFGKLNGIGLGLYNTKKSVESWKGDIECESLPQGTRFIISLPLVQTGVVFVDLPPKGNIKVIDDEAFVPMSLKTAGYEVVEFAQNFDEGRKLLAKGNADGVAILVDYRLDNKNFGTELIAEQSSRRNILLCTNDYDSLPIIQRAKEIGVKILPKPLCFFAEPTPGQPKAGVSGPVVTESLSFREQPQI